MDNKSTLCSDAENFAPLPYEDAGGEGIVSIRGGFFMAQCRSRIRITRPVRALAIPEAPHSMQQNSSVASMSVTAASRHIGHFNEVSIKRDAPEWDLPGRVHTQLKTDVPDYGTDEAASGEIASPVNPMRTTNERLSWLGLCHRTWTIPDSNGNAPAYLIRQGIPAYGLLEP
jgi:hypothetical protein